MAKKESDAQDVIKAASMTFHAIGVDRGGTNPLNDLRTLGQLVRLFTEVKPDIVHLVTIKPNLYGGTGSRLLGIPAVHTVNGIGYTFIGQASLRRKTLRKALLLAYRTTFTRRRCRVIFQNPTDRDQFVSSRLVAPEKASLIPSAGVDIERFAPRELPSGPPVVLLPARLLRDKGVEEFVAAAQAIKATHPEVRFALVGRVDEKNPAGIAQERVEQWVSEGLVEWWGPTANEKMPETYAKAHLVVLPSYREGLSLALAEAQAVGRAYVTTDVPGCRDAIDAGTTGWLVPAHDSQSLARTIENALGDERRLVRFSRAAAVFAQEHFAQEKVFTATIALYRDLRVPGCPSRP